MIKIAISRCLLGESVRYDATHKKLENLDIFFQDHEITLVPFCPEIAIGLGVPRPPIQLVTVAGQIHAKGVNDKNVDVTDRLEDYAKQFLSEHEDLMAIINKKGSPSCGYLTTKCYQDDRLVSELASGIFLSYIKQRRPELPIIDELQCQAGDNLEIFIKNIKKAR